MTFEQELYNNFSIYLSKPYFLTFAGDVSPCLKSFDCVRGNHGGDKRPADHEERGDKATLADRGVQEGRPLSPILLLSHVPSQTCQVGLNFASEEETKRFRSHMAELLDRRQRKSGTC